VSLPGVSLPGVSLPGVSLPGVSLPGVSLQGAVLLGAALLAAPALAADVPPGEGAGEGLAALEAPGDGAPLRFEAEALTRLPGTLGDPLRGVMLLPGVGQVASGLSQPVVRGTQPSSTGVWLDGVRLPYLGHLLVGPGVLHPALVSHVEVHRGGAPARLGRDTGGEVELQVARPGEGRPVLGASVDLLGLGAHAAAVLPGGEGGTEVSAAGRLAWSPLLGATVLNLARPAEAGRLTALFYDYQARAARQLGPAQLRVLALGAGDAAGLEGVAPGGRAGLSFHRVDVRARLPAGPAALEAGVTLGLDRLEGRVGGRLGQVAEALTERSVAARLQAALPLSLPVSLPGPSLWLHAGADVDVRGVDVSRTSSFQPAGEGPPPPVLDAVEQPLARATLAGAWAEAVFAGGGWRVVPGLRVDAYLLQGGAQRVVAEPRLHVRRELGEAWAVRGSAGLHHQAPGYLVDVPGAEVASLRLGLQRAVQLGVGADWAPPEGPWAASVDLFVHPLLRTVELSLLDADFLSLQPEALAGAREARGLAAGAEVLVQRRLGGGWTGLLGYAVQRVQRTPAAAAGTAAPVAWGLEQAHVLRAAAHVELGGGWSAGAGAHLNTGSPEAGAGLTTFTRVPLSDAAGERWVPAERGGVQRLPAFWRLDARVARQWEAGPVRWRLSLELLNASLSRETLRYDYRRAADGSLQRLAAPLPPVTLPHLQLEGRL
jgi:hypothetical protein